MSGAILVTVTGPTAEPVTVQEARADLSLADDMTHDTLLERLISAARSSVEAATGMRCMSQTVRLDLDGFPSGDIDLGCYPVSAITIVAYDDSDGVAQTLVSGTDYWPALSGMYPRIVPINGWPDTYPGKPASVRVTMTAGYGSAALVPADVKHAIRVRTVEMFERRGESVEGISVASVPLSLSVLLAAHSRWTA